jgi:hypothetical protein
MGPGTLAEIDDEDLMIMKVSCVMGVVERAPRKRKSRDDWSGQ